MYDLGNTLSSPRIMLSAWMKEREKGQPAPFLEANLLSEIPLASALLFLGSEEEFAEFLEFQTMDALVLLDYFHFNYLS